MQFIFLGLAVLIAVCDILFCLKRGLWRSLVRVLTQAASLVAAYILTGVVAKKLMALETIPVTDESVAKFLAENPDALTIVKAFCATAAAPIIFLICYCVLKFITLLVYYLVCGLFDIEGPKNGFARVMGGACMGLVSAAIGITVMCTGLMGYAVTADDAVWTMLTATEETNAILTADERSASTEKGEDGASFATFTEKVTPVRERYLEPLANAPVASQFYRALGAPLFSRLTTVQVEGSDFSFGGEINSLAVAVGHLGGVSADDVSNLGEKDIAALRLFAGDVQNSKTISTLGSIGLRSAADLALGEDGTNGLASSNENVRLMIGSVREIFSTSTPQNVATDLYSVVDVMDVLVRYEVLAKLKESDSEIALLDMVSNSAFLQEINGILADNRRMRPIVDAIADIGVRKLLAAHGLPQEDLEKYQLLSSEIADVLYTVLDEKGQIDSEQLTTELGNFFEEKDILISDNAVKLVGNVFSNEFVGEDLRELDISEVTDRLYDRLTNVEMTQEPQGTQE